MCRPGVHQVWTKCTPGLVGRRLQQDVVCTWSTPGSTGGLSTVHALLLMQVTVHCALCAVHCALCTVTAIVTVTVTVTVTVIVIVTVTVIVTIIFPVTVTVSLI